ncbi:hypothetical protein SAMN05216548_108177 [Faunimonas pinastri]|uniref:Uncharacterized protein n=1 Tax=Faunimonas pinastri TaxID=1855383 RepID=A0A1H9JLV3_9HYPH|nr:hypothetical protein [Faunimonas pinastri]SEQ87807.1 hypothetical protein SAMN05216548_108177 [Faunimonas pinastri]
MQDFKRHREFQDLKRSIGLTAEELAPLLGKTVETVQRYGVQRSSGRPAPDKVIARMRSMARDQAVSTLADQGLLVKGGDLLKRIERRIDHREREEHAW